MQANFKKFTLQPLPFSLDGLEPYLSQETLKYHHGRHQKGYVERLNQLLEVQKHPESLEELSLERLMVDDPFRSPTLVNQAAQIWNHEFLWSCLAPLEEGGEPQSIEAYLGAGGWSSMEGFKSEAWEKAASHFGSGWLWLSLEADKPTLRLESLPNAENPLMHGRRALWTVDLWEHAHYIDFRNDRKAYFEAIWALTRWKALAQRLEEACPTLIW